MIRGLGIDLCGIARMDRILQTSPHFLEKYYSSEEIAYLNGRNALRSESAAAMYAAKEAFLKAIGTGIGGGVSLNEVTVLHGDNGRPCYKLTGAALDAMRVLGAEAAFLSLTHENDMAAAVCVLEG